MILGSPRSPAATLDCLILRNTDLVWFTLELLDGPAVLLGHLLAVELVGQRTLLLGDLVTFLDILAMLDRDLSALRLGGSIAGGSIHWLI